MRTITLLLATLVFGINTVLACDSFVESSEELINKEQAIDRLNQTLFMNKKATGKRLSIEAIDCYLDKQLKLNSDHSDLILNIRGPLKDLSNAANSARSQEEKRAVIERLNQHLGRDSGTGFIMLPQANRTTSLHINLFNRFIDQYCQADASLECTKSTQMAQNLWHIVGEYRALSGQLNQADKVASLAFNDKLDRQWRSYKNDTILLWPQEVLLNSIVYQPSQKGLSSPPNYKLLSLRPSIGLSYLSDQSHRIQPTLNVDLLGVYWWQYDQDGIAKKGRGISASLVWDGDDSAYGITYHHTPKWSFTMAKGDDNDLVVSVSFQLAHWLVNSK